MSRSERVLPFAVSLFAPAISVLNTSLISDEVNYSALTLNYIQGSLMILVLWYLNKWLLIKSTKVESKKKMYGLIAFTNAIVIVGAAALSSSTMAVDIAGELSFVFLAIRLVIVVLIFNIILRIFDEQKKNTALQVQNLSLKTENLKFQVDMLKQQINPHFLFNSLNTLLDLVENKSDDAVEFVQNFSGLYRNVLQSAKYDFISLEQELEFLDAYWSLLQVRFKDAIELHIFLDDSKKDFLIPPLSLQFLIENAIKHNQYSEEEPMTISISEIQNTLIVINPIKKIDFPVASEKVGLLNLQQRFSILYQPIKWNEEQGYFKVQLPLKPINHVD